MSVVGGLGGGGGREREDGGDDRQWKAQARKPLDHLQHQDEQMRQLLESILRLANVGNVPALLMKKTGKPKPYSERFNAVRNWCNGLDRAPQNLMAAKFSELSEALVHVLRAATAAGHFDNVVRELVLILTRTAESAHGGSDEEEI
jgi:hypothetical protein